jgi:hypothetical protein
MWEQVECRKVRNYVCASILCPHCTLRKGPIKDCSAKKSNHRSPSVPFVSGSLGKLESVAWVFHVSCSAAAGPYFDPISTLPICGGCGPSSLSAVAA